MIYIYWLLAIPTGLLASVVILMTLAGQRLSSATPHWLGLLAAAAVLSLVGYGYKVGVSSEKPGIAVLLVVSSWVVFASIMLINGIMRQTTWN